MQLFYNKKRRILTKKGRFHLWWNLLSKSSNASLFPRRSPTGLGAATQRKAGRLGHRNKFL